MDERRSGRGQSLLEMAIILPVLLILLFGVVEVGFGLRNYILVANANREAARFAARGRFSDERVIERLVSSGGVVRKGGADVAFLGLYGTAPNTGIIITHIDIDDEYETGDPITLPAPVISGVLPISPGEVVDEDLLILIPGTDPPVFRDDVRWISAMDTKISTADIIDLHGPATESINATREYYERDPMDNNIVVVETFFMHHPLGKGLLPDPWMMYTQTEMRVVTDRAE